MEFYICIGPPSYKALPACSVSILLSLPAFTDVVRRCAERAAVLGWDTLAFRSLRRSLQVVNEIVTGGIKEGDSFSDRDVMALGRAGFIHRGYRSSVECWLKGLAKNLAEHAVAQSRVLV